MRVQVCNKSNLKYKGTCTTLTRSSFRQCDCLVAIATTVSVTVAPVVVPVAVTVAVAIPAVTVAVAVRVAVPIAVAIRVAVSVAIAVGAVAVRRRLHLAARVALVDVRPAFPCVTEPATEAARLESLDGAAALYVNNTPPVINLTAITGLVCN